MTLYPSSSAAFRQRFLDDSRLLVKDNSTGFSPGRMELKTPLILLMSMAGLLVAMCAINMATLLLLRAAGRAREMSMRYALGARRGRIVSQLLVEGGLLGLIGAGAGLALAPVAARVLVRLMTHAASGQAPYSAAIDGRLLLFTMGISFMASVLFSAAPVLHFLRPNLAGALRQHAWTAGKGTQRFRKLAVGAQIALGVVLLGGAGLLMRTLDNLRKQPVGFNTNNLLTFALDPTASGYGEDRTPKIIASALENLRSMPGVSSVAASTDPELQGNDEGDGFTVQGYKANDELMSFESPWITPGYFATLRQPVLMGREFTDADLRGPGRPKVAVVNLAFAKRFYGSAQSALGHMVGEGSNTPDTTIVGVVGNVKHVNLRTQMRPAIYRAYFQYWHPEGVEVYLRTAMPPETVETAIHKTIHDLDPTIVVDELKTMGEQIDVSAANERALAMLSMGFSLLAMLLAAVGLFGVLACSTEQRVREFGVRLALGSPRTRVIGLVVREMVWIATAASALALPAVVALARLFQSQLYGVTAGDTSNLVWTSGWTAVTVTCAAALPAWKAASIEPVDALRAE